MDTSILAVGNVTLISLSLSAYRALICHFKADSVRDMKRHLGDRSSAELIAYSDKSSEGFRLWTGHLVKSHSICVTLRADGPYEAVLLGSNRTGLLENPLHLSHYSGLLM